MEAESFPMNGGDSAFSYTKNSQFQREGSNFAKEMIGETIAEKLDIENLASTSNTIRIADLGCSVGPNTFFCVQNIIDAMEKKLNSRSLTSKIPEFQVFFSDHASNDFNTLFTSLPLDRQYFAAGVPGSFHTRLFPDSSLHFVHSSYALQWLSKVPQEVLNKASPAWNRGRIHYTSAPEEVSKAFAAQFARDVECFLDARAQELVAGGMMVVIMPGLSDGCPYSEYPAGVLFNFLGYSLMDMVKEGSLSEAQVDSFNLPVYTPSPKEMRELIQNNGHFSIERVELNDPRSRMAGPMDISAIVTHLRAGFEGILTKHFGSTMIDELFERMAKASGEISSILESRYRRGENSPMLEERDAKGTQLFLVLKRK